MRADLVFYVSGHGLGHATRSGAVIEALAATSGGSDSIAVRSSAPEWIFAGRAPGIAYHSAAIDVGVIQSTALDLDLSATLAAHEDFLTDWEGAVEREAEWIRRSEARAVVADVPPLAFAAASRAGIPAFAIANFSWDWILDAYARSDPRWAPMVARYRQAYHGAKRLFRLPLHGDLSCFPRIVDVPHLVNRSRRDAAECRGAAGIADDEPRRVVLVSFGDLAGSALEPSGGTELDDYLFLGMGRRPAAFRGDWLEISGQSNIRHEELICASDAVLGKPGYSTVAEVIAHERRFLYVPRSSYRENSVLERGLAESACARSMPRDDFASGRWRPHLDALFDQPSPPPAPATHGAETIAAALVELLRGQDA